jgi:hypothetical protein
MSQQPPPLSSSSHFYTICEVKRKTRIKTWVQGNLREGRLRGHNLRTEPKLKRKLVIVIYKRGNLKQCLILWY